MSQDIDRAMIAEKIEDRDRELDHANEQINALRTQLDRVETDIRLWGASFESTPDDTPEGLGYIARRRIGRRLDTSVRRLETAAQGLRDTLHRARRAHDVVEALTASIARREEV